MSSREGSPETTTGLNKKEIKNESPASPDLTHKDERNADESEKVVNPDDLIDMNTFEQLLDMDDEDDHEFSYSIVNNYFEQAGSTFEDMGVALEKKDLNELSRLGHFLKGSSAAIGLKKVKATCEKIQNVGNCQEEDGTGELDKDEALKRITPLLPQVIDEYSEAEEYLKNFYEVQDAR
ncbi:histidine-phosphotransfer domain HPT domain-containing protein [Mucor ambiguus]|uniref:Histidine-phosphotransfer domain HPT domain-containing protein n=1 Tax=Mucor ambiguus TaxID=91626 RepID=A0A0C9MSY5_9FUNG|nr:histidine-phosphotransfer domain HPT domain-containing protein [Mucor ambiguus]